VEAIGLLEVQSIACGIDVADAMLKAAPVEFVDTFMASPGKYLVLVHGDPSSVESSVRAGTAAAGDQQLDQLIIPFLDPQVLQAIRLQSNVQEIAAIGVIETSTVASGVLAADAAAKAADVRLLALHLARGIGGKSVLTMTGVLHDVQASVDAGSAPAASQDLLVATRIIANPHPDLVARVLASSRPTPVA